MKHAIYITLRKCADILEEALLLKKSVIQAKNFLAHKIREMILYVRDIRDWKFNGYKKIMKIIMK